MHLSCKFFIAQPGYMFYQIVVSITNYYLKIENYLEIEGHYT